PNGALGLILHSSSINISLLTELKEFPAYCTCSCLLLFLDLHVSDNSFIRQQSQSAFHCVPFNLQLPHGMIAAVRKFIHERALLFIILEIQHTHRLRLSVYDLVRSNSNLVRPVQFSDSVNYLLVVTGREIADADRFACPVADQL